MFPVYYRKIILISILCIISFVGQYGIFVKISNNPYKIYIYKEYTIKF